MTGVRPLPRASLCHGGMYADAPRHAERRWLVCDRCAGIVPKEGTGGGLLHTAHQQIGENEWRCTRCLATRTW